MNPLAAFWQCAAIFLSISAALLLPARCAAAGAPTITAQPSSGIVVQGGNFVATVLASSNGAALSYRWQCNATTLADSGRIVGSTSNVLAVSNAQLRDAGSYQVIITNVYGAVTSSVATLVIGAPAITFNTNGAGWTTNETGSFSTPEIKGGLLTLTDSGNNQARSFFYNTPQGIGGFGASFTYQAGGNLGADGMAFILQNDPRGATALGATGGSLGVSGITPSLALEFNLYSGSGNGLGYGVFVNGANGPNTAPGSINLGSGHPIGVTLFYDGQTSLFLTMTDAVTGAFYRTNLAVGSITNTVGGRTAYVGFSGATGGLNAIQTVTNFTFMGGLSPNPVFTPLGQLIFATNSTWKYFKGVSEASTPDPATWRTVGFNDDAWLAGAAPLYYEMFPAPANPYAYSGNTALNDMRGAYSSVFMRQAFVLTNLAQISALQLTAMSDDGFIAWINGTEVARFNAPAGSVAYNGHASSDLLAPVPLQNYRLSNPQAFLRSGTNVIAIQALVRSATNSAFTISAELSASISAPWSALGISEFMATNRNTLQDEDGESSPWIELFNPTAASINLLGWSLTDDTNNLAKWPFPNVVLLDADDANGSDNFMVVFASGKNRANYLAELHTNFKLSPGGGYLALVNPSQQIASSFTYPPQTTDVSFGCDSFNRNAVGYLTVPTPGNPNTATGTSFAPAVTFSRTGGTFVSPFQLQLSAAATNAVIRYTTDGTMPTSDSTVYAGALTIDQSVQVRARSFADGLMPGPFHSESFVRLDASLLNITSDLPAIVLYNFGAGDVPADATQSANLAVYEPQNGITRLTNAPTLNTRSGIHLRGSSTLGLPKNAFAVGFCDDLNNDVTYSPLGMPAESSWVLYACDNFEPVLIHNPLVYQLSNEIGRYAPRTRFVEVYLNTTGGPLTAANYNGIYVLEEKIKWGNNRVNIQKTRSVDNLNPRDNTGTNLTGGYVMKIDRLGAGESGFYSAGQSIAYDYPKETELKTPQRAPQQQYLQNYMDAFGTALNGASYTNPTTGYRAFVDVPSWIDSHLLNITTFNVDALRLSAYFFKDRNGPLQFGPVWDFDRSQGSTDGRDFNPRTWRSDQADLGTDCFNYVWWGRMFTDIDFWQAWIDRYQELRAGVLSTNHIFGAIDALAAQVRNAEPREIARWPGLTAPRSGTWTVAGYSYNFPGTYQGEINFMKQWYTDRLNFMDTNFVAQPVFNNNTGAITPGFALVLTAQSGSTIYYTTNNTDPRLPGGGLSTNALIYTAPIALSTNITFLARAYNPNHFNLTGTNNPPLSSPWSGLARQGFILVSPPVITGRSPNLQAYLGQSPAFIVTAAGTPPPVYQWQLNGTNLLGQTNAQLTITLLQTNQAGTYSVTVTNLAGTAGAAFVLTVTPRPNLVITEVMTSESKGAVGSTLDHLDWWELSNFGNFAVNLQGFRFDDDHFSFSDADTITNNVTIAPGESIVLAQDMTPDQFRTWWGPQNLPANLQIITYPNIGFSATSDAIYLWNAAANTITDTLASVTFSVATRGVSFGFDPASRAFGALSIAGHNGAFVAAVNGDIGSPGSLIDPPRFTQLNFNPPAGMNLSFVTVAGFAYRVEYKNNLTDATWTPLTNFVATASLFNLADPSTNNNATRFYRVMASP